MSRLIVLLLLVLSAAYLLSPSAVYSVMAVVASVVICWAMIYVLAVLTAAALFVACCYWFPGLCLMYLVVNVVACCCYANMPPATPTKAKTSYAVATPAQHDIVAKTPIANIWKYQRNSQHANSVNSNAIPAGVHELDSSRSYATHLHIDTSSSKLLADADADTDTAADTDADAYSSAKNNDVVITIYDDYLTVDDASMTADLSVPTSNTWCSSITIMCCAIIVRLALNVITAAFVSNACAVPSHGSFNNTTTGWIPHDGGLVVASFPNEVFADGHNRSTSTTGSFSSTMVDLFTNNNHSDSASNVVNPAGNLRKYQSVALTVRGTSSLALFTNITSDAASYVRTVVNPTDVVSCQSVAVTIRSDSSAAIVVIAHVQTQANIKAAVKDCFGCRNVTSLTANMRSLVARDFADAGFPVATCCNNCVTMGSAIVDSLLFQQWFVFLFIMVICMILSAATLTVAIEDGVGPSPTDPSCSISSDVVNDDDDDIAFGGHDLTDVRDKSQNIDDNSADNFVLSHDVTDIGAESHNIEDNSSATTNSTLVDYGDPIWPQDNDICFGWKSKAATTSFRKVVDEFAQDDSVVFGDVYEMIVERLANELGGRYLVRLDSDGKPCNLKDKGNWYLAKAEEIYRKTKSRFDECRSGRHKKAKSENRPRGRPRKVINRHLC